MPSTKMILIIAIAFCCACAKPATAQLDFESAPIEYGKKPGRDRVAKLAEALESGKTTLTVDAKFGVLPSLLKELDISPESQTLVFSKTSFQIHKITPNRPRAIYFNDDTYAGWVRDSDILELAASDPEQGALFYTLDYSKKKATKIIRDQGQCLICHGTIRTQGVPGFLIRSVYAGPTGHIVSGTPTFVTDHTSPFEERWGGWYVTGKHGSLKHLGNVVCRDESMPGWIDKEIGQNNLTLPDSVTPAKYLRPSSDLVALMVMEHQTQVHNLMTRANFESRTAAHQDQAINQALERPEDFESETTQRRIAGVSEKLLKYLLMADEISLSSPISGSSNFAAEFSQRGPCDSRGRSLYQLDLQTRLFKYPCSFLIYSESFDALPERVKMRLGQRLRELLIERTNDAGFERLRQEDRAAIQEILAETKSAFWSNYVLSE
jgi:hypothetical protein